MILSVSNINKTFVDKCILKDISFFLNDHDKAAIVGINGAGKSTLLKIIIGELTPDSGNVSKSSGASLGYLSQYQTISDNRTIYEEMLEVKKDIILMEQSLREIELKMQDCDKSQVESLSDNYAKINHAFELNGGYTYKSEINGVLKGLGFSEEDFSSPIANLSGGQKTRVALAGLLLSKPDILLLDEPTNHLDISSISWLETFITNYKGTVLIVSHDRYFLDKTVSRIIEIENCKSHVYEGNYTQFAEKKKKLRDAQIKAYIKQQAEIKHEQEVIDKLRSFKQEKFYKRAQSREKALEKMDVYSMPDEINDKFKISLVPEYESGNDVLDATDLSLSFADMNGEYLCSNINFSIKKGERIALIGDNGTGKSTLLKAITGDKKDSLLVGGVLSFGANVSIGYYDQEHHTLNDNKTLFDEISDTYPNMNNTKIRNTLAAFLFTGDDVFKQISELSGGEKGRLSLAKLMLSNSNFLILDEPTNHLDMASKEILESAINSYEGTVLFVSHDRYFINKTCTRILELSQKTILNYIGNYDYYLEKRDLINGLASNSNTTSDKTTDSSKNTTLSGLQSGDENATQPLSSKDDWKKQKELNRKKEKLTKELNLVEDDITKSEDKKTKIEEDMANPLFARDAAKLISLQKDLESTNSILEDLYLKWEELSEELQELSEELQS